MTGRLDTAQNSSRGEIGHKRVPTRVYWPFCGVLRVARLSFMLTALLLVISHNFAYAQGVYPAGSWDKTLPSIELSNVRVKAASLQDAWKQLSSKFSIRSILLVSDEIPQQELPFDFAVESCSVRDLYDALAANYGNLKWTQDPQTGVVWFHPSSVRYEDILPSQIGIPDDQLGLRMQTHILEPLGEDDSLRIRVKRWGTLFRNTFDYSVDIPKGVYALRDVLNLCCAAHPAKTFSLVAWRRYLLVCAVNLTCDKPASKPRPGELHWWRTYIGPTTDDGPTPDEVRTRLADTDRKLRWAARAYVSSRGWSIPFDQWARASGPPEQALWVCLGLTSILVRGDGATHIASIRRMRKEATDDFLMTCNPGLAVLTAFELARLTGDTRAIHIVSGRNFAPGQLSGVVPDACRIARGSKTIQDALRQKGCAWLVVSDERLRAIEKLQDSTKLLFSTVPNEAKRQESPKE